MPPYIALTPASDTIEISAWRRGVPLADQETAELLLPLRPEVTPRRRGIPAHVRAAALIATATIGAGICFVVDLLP